MWKLFLGFMLFCGIASSKLPLAGAADLSAHDVMEKNDGARRIPQVTAKAKLTTGGGGTKERVKEFTWWRKLTPVKDLFNTMTRFQAPAEVRGEGILFLEQPGGKADVQIYLPNFKKIRRVEQQEQSGSFMGSEFSYSDIAAPHLEDFNYKLLKQENCPKPGDEKLKCYVIESTPATDAVKERTGSSRGDSWIRSDNFMAVKGEYYDLEGSLWKKMEAADIKEVDVRQNKWMAMHVRMDNVKNDKFTLLDFSGVKTDQKIPDSTFTTQNLQHEK